MYQNDPMKVLTGEVRLSYANLTKPRASQPGAEEKYSCTLLIPKADVRTKADIDSAIAAAYEEGVRDKWKGVRPTLRYPGIYDGDGERAGGGPFGAECKGHWVVTASSKQKPNVVHPSNLQVELAPSDIYSGMFGRVTIRFYPYANNGNKGVGCGLQNVLKTRDGEPLGGHANAESDFAAIAAEYQQPTPAAPVYAPPVPQQPAAASYYQPPAAPQQYIDPITGQPMAAPWGA